MNVIEVSREELYEQVWTIPMRRLALQYGISDVALAKTCRRLKIPKPGLGYWARVAAGQKIRRPTLPKTGPDSPQMVRLRRVENPQEPPAPSIPKPKPPQVEMRSDLAAAHDAIRKLGNTLPDADVDKYDRLVISGVLTVSVAAHRRALLILDALVAVLDARGHRVSFRNASQDDPTNAALEVKVAETSVALSIEEELDRKNHVPTATERKEAEGIFGRKPPIYDYFAGGRLRLTVRGTLLRSTWCDSRTRRLERQLGRAVLAVEAEPDAQQAAREAAERERRVQEERKRREEEEKIRREQEAAEAEYQDRLKRDLRRMARRWRTATELREFLKAFESACTGEPPKPDVTAWLAWAAAYAGNIDPLSRRDDVPKSLDAPRTKLSK